MLSIGFRMLDHRNKVCILGDRRNLAPTRSAFMIVQEAGDLRLQHGGVVRFARRRVLEEPALDVSRQIIPFADKGVTPTFQDSALHVAQIAGS
jgi:hypothetical protein